MQTGEGQWAQVANESPYLTLKNGSVSFSLEGYARYKITIDGGCFYCLTTSTTGGSISPNFYLTVE